MVSRLLSVVIAASCLPAINAQRFPASNVTTTTISSPLSSSTSLDSPGIGAQILAGLGASSSPSFFSLLGSTNPESATPKLADASSSTSSSTLIRSTSSEFALPKSAGAVQALSSSSSHSSQAARTVCSLGRCFTDVSFTASSLPYTGTGSIYASKCSALQVSFTSASNAFTSKHQFAEDQTISYGGTTITPVTYYSAAITLCDGNARVHYSPAIPVSTGHVTSYITPTASATVQTITFNWNFPLPTPSCTIAPDDCDNLYAIWSSSMLLGNQTSSSMLSGNQTSASSAMASTTPMAQPPCANSSAIALQSSLESDLRKCGPCTMYGEGVQLLYFPVASTVSRDMCASTPIAKLTHYGPGVGSVVTRSTAEEATYANNTDIALYQGHTFTSGTAYISISSVWAEDRCSSTIGSPVIDAIIAMPSESLLSLRYSQDHFQHFYTSSTQTGYPFNYADLNEPIPWSAWNGQAQCGGPYQGAGCGIIYENQYNPQLAIPPGIRKLRPEFENCQVWYGGLYDPPHTLQPETAFATPTFQAESTKTPAAAASAVITVSPPTAYATSPNIYTQPTVVVYTTVSGLPIGYDPSNSAAAVTFAGQTLQPGDPAATIGDITISVGSNGAFFNGQPIAQASSTVAVGQSRPEADSGDTSMLTIGTDTLSVGGKAYTIPDGKVVSVATGGVVEGAQSTVEFTQISYVNAAAPTLVSNGQSGTAEVLSDVTVVATESTTTSVEIAAATITDSTATSGSAASDGSSPTATIPDLSTTLDAIALSSAIITVGSSTLTFISQTNEAVSVAGTTLSVGGSALTLPNGGIVTVVSGGGVVVSQASTVPYSVFDAAQSVRASSMAGPSTSTTPSSITAFMSDPLAHSATTGDIKAQATSTSGAGPSSVSIGLATVLSGLLAFVLFV